MAEHLPEIVLAASTIISAVPVPLRPHKAALVYGPPLLAALPFVLLVGAIYSSLAFRLLFFFGEPSGSTGDRARGGNFS